MLRFVLASVLAMLFLRSVMAEENRWTGKVADAVRAARESPTEARLIEALDVCWRADDWRAGLQLAEFAAQQHPDKTKLAAYVARAYWRGGRIQQAEQLVTRWKLDDGDTVAAQVAIAAYLAQGDLEHTAQWLDRLQKLGPRTASDWYHVFAAKTALRDYAGLAEILRKAESAVDAKGGYPDNFLEESVAGLSAFFTAVGTEPLNQVRTYGNAPLAPLPLFNLPFCEVLINGHGPYRLVLDTGGSIMVALDQGIAEDLGLKSVAPATVRGVSGTEETGQVLLDKVQIGNIECRRVLCRTFDVRTALMNSADGILGTGIFAQARMTLDLEGGHVSVTPSQAEAPAGSPLDIRIIGDAKIMALAPLDDTPCVALLDSGADAVALATSWLEHRFPDERITRIDVNLGIGIGSSATPEVAFAPPVAMTLAGRKLDNFGGLGLDVLDKVISPVLGVQTDVLVGMPVFRQMRTFTVDFPRSKAWAEWLPKGRD